MIFLLLASILIQLGLSLASSECENTPIDLSIVLDQTKSVGARNYDKMLETVRKLISKYNVGPDQTRVSIVTFAKQAEIRVSFDDDNYQSQKGLNKLIDEMIKKDKLKGTTRTDIALETVGKDVFNSKKGDRPDAPNVMILFTDGATNPKSKPYSQVIPPLVDKGVHRIAVGIGKDIKSSELEEIAGGPNRVVNAKSFSALENELAKIREITCSIDGGYTAWSQWSKCSATCGGGSRSHSRTCTNPPPKNKGKSCEEQKNLGPAMESEACNTQKCGTDGGYSGWSDWSACSVTCGGGLMWKQRQCNNPKPSGDGKTCKEQSLGPNKESKACNTQKCGTDGGYSKWSDWSACSVTCGGGLMWKRRQCNSPKPSGDGKTCKEQNLGPDKQSKACNTQKCGTDGGYSKWSDWSDCSVTCGGGLMWKHRQCNNPKPSGDGKTCKEQGLGPDKQSKACNTQKCGVDGNWSSWGKPGPCDKTCGRGVRKIKRTCTNPPPSGDGKKCRGLSTKTESCNTQQCKIMFPILEGPPPPPPPCKEHLDVGIILDSSNSIAPVDYQRALAFLQRLVDRLQISERGTHMAILLYSWEAHTIHKFTDAQTANSLKNAIKALPHIRGGTRTDRALELAGQDFFGWKETGDRPDVPNVLLVLTDGDTNEGSKPFPQVLPPLKTARVRRIAVGIGKEVHIDELQEIAGNSDDVIKVISYSHLVSKLENIMDLACKNQHPGSCGSWGSYESCSKTCGSGFKIRRRSCPGNSLHLTLQKTICNTNLCPGQRPCQDSLSNCPTMASAGQCWKKAVGQAFQQTFTLWNQCKKSCRRCNVDPQCQDNDPYKCPWLAAKKPSVCSWALKYKCKKSCGTCKGKEKNGSKHVDRCFCFSSNG
ncbi:coadhesin-like [Acropora palmata]|uniref:coadhesin-like n=1 Tax=Acropora palmata TaxID=6131 RepID=UPI003DA04499